MKDKTNNINWKQFRDEKFPKLCEQLDLSHDEYEGIVSLRVGLNKEYGSIYNNMCFHKDGKMTIEAPIYNEIIIKENITFERMLKIIEVIFRDRINLDN